jgi:hypothetical protein
MATHEKDQTVSFTLNRTTAFFLYGSVNIDHAPKRATLTPLTTGGSPKVTVIDDFSSALDWKQILYWESGLDWNEIYTVEITNLDDSKYFSFSSLDILHG